MKKSYYIYKPDNKVITILPYVILLICVGILYLLYPNISFKMIHDDLGIAVILMIPYFILHEIFHSISYVIHGAKFKNVTYGACLEKGVLFCLCKQNISKKNILISLVYPFIFLGVITLIIGKVFNFMPLVLLSLLNITGCSADLVMFFDFLKIKDFEYSEFDDPTAFGIYTSEDYSNKKMFGLKYVEKKDNLNIIDYRKVVISKTSAIIFAIFIVMIIMSLCL